MRLRSLCEALLLLCLCAIPSLAAGGQTLAIRRAHQPGKADRITYTVKDQSLGQALAPKNPSPSKPSLNPKTVVISRIIASRKLVHRRTFCRPKLCESVTSGVSGSTSTSNSSSKGSAQIPLPDCGKWLRTLTSLVAVLLLYST